MLSGASDLKIEHVAIDVQDLEKARAFFRRYFDGASNEGYHNPKTGLRTYFISFQGGTRLEWMARPDVKDRPRSLLKRGYAHLAFSLGSREAVDSLTRRLREDGYRVISGPRTTGDGYYESCVEGVEGNLIELTV